jgi:hypothetical protein
MATDVYVGIRAHSGALIDSVEVTSKCTEHMLPNSNGNPGRVGVNAKMKSFAVKGHGTLSAVVGLNSANLSNVSGGVTTILEVKQEEHNTTWNGWSYSGNNYPVAQPVTLSDA